MGCGYFVLFWGALVLLISLLEAMGHKWRVGLCEVSIAVVASYHLNNCFCSSLYFERHGMDRFISTLEATTNGMATRAICLEATIHRSRLHHSILLSRQRHSSLNNTSLSRPYIQRFVSRQIARGCCTSLKPTSNDVASSD